MAKMQKRKLVAVLFADIVGYTATMQQDEVQARQQLDKFHFELSTHVEEHQGKIINNYGDGCLCIFESVVAAVQCAKELQQAFNDSVLVPVRIGLHSGEVFFEKDNVFGDAVNIASRIESMGVPGSVLLSGTVATQIKNQEAFHVSALGKFEFKNVEGKIKVYALTGAGLSVPAAEKMQGKLKKTAPSPKARRRWWPLVIGALILLIGGLWLVGGLGIRDYVQEQLSPTDREKRLVIPDFRNDTNDPSFDAFGKMVADLLTRALMNKEGVDIISAQNIEGEIAKANLSTTANTAFAKATGVDLVVLGNYYQLENDLHISADIVDIREGKVLHQLQLSKPNGEKSKLLAELQQQLLSYWAVKDNARFLEKPPKYEAFQAYLEASRLYTSNPAGAIAQLEKSYQLDSSFYAPLLSLIPLYERMQEEKKLRNTFRYLQQREAGFSNWEKLKFNALTAMEKGQYLEAALMQERLYAMDRSDAGANYNAAFLYNNANQPGKALELLNDIDERYLGEQEMAISWRGTQKAFAHYRLQQYEPILQLAANYTSPKMFTVLAVQHLKALVQLDSVAALERAFVRYRQVGVYSPSGQLDLPDHIYLIVCNELLLTGKTDLLKSYARQLGQWLEDNEVADLSHEVPDIYNNRGLRKEEAEGFVQYYLGDYAQAAAIWEKEQIPPGNWPDRIERASRLGVAFAKSGELKKAEAQLEKIRALRINHRDFEATQLYYSARVLAAIDRKETAVSNIRKALDLGFIFFRPAVLDPTRQV
ncbi:MAG: adenylate/guanylate cyclase domain-containing protein, partial [Bacteroidota bacterium]